MNYPKYSKYKSGNKDANSYWHHHCGKEQIPFVTIEYKTFLCDIEYDYITYDSNIDNVLLKNEIIIKDKAEELFAKYKNTSSSIAFSFWGGIKFRNIELEKSEVVASELYDLIKDITENKTSHIN